MFSAMQKRRAFKPYAKDLPALLRKDYGRSDYYTPAQIAKTLQRHNLSQKYAIFAYAAYMSKDAFRESFPENEAGYESLRQEIADGHFGGNANFGVGDSGIGDFDSFGGGADTDGGSDFGGSSD